MPHLHPPSNQLQLAPRVLPLASSLNAAISHALCTPGRKASHLPVSCHNSLLIWNLWFDSLLPQRLPHCKLSSPIFSLYLVLRSQSDPLPTSLMMSLIISHYLLHNHYETSMC